MLKMESANAPARALLVLTVGLIVAQLCLLWTGSLTNQLFDEFVATSLSQQILSSKVFWYGLCGFIFAQVVLYAVYGWLVWYIAIQSAARLKLQRVRTLTFVIGFWCLSYACIFLWNATLSPHSFFADVLHQPPFWDVQDKTLLAIAIFLSGLWLILFSFALMQLCLDLCRRKFYVAHRVFLTFTLILLSLFAHDYWQTRPVQYATKQKPNIIFIGLDSIRPDFIGFNQTQQPTQTPVIDAFLSNAIVYSQAYASLPRTFPSWVSILTGDYPLHTQARDNNTNVNNLQLKSALPYTLAALGYETIYGTDDTRFNNTNESLGFDKVITPPMGINDFVFATINDAPLSNLIIPTFLGRYFFPYSFANHGAAITFNPNNYLQLLQAGLHNRADKPLFLSIHLTLNHWPFYHFNDKQRRDANVYQRYAFSMPALDQELQQVIDILKANNLLDHSVVVLLSDHGTSLGLPGDRITRAKNYVGLANNIKKLSINPYVDAPPYSLDYKHDYGVDTTYGYGGDVLSLKQYHALLAIQIHYPRHQFQPNIIATRVSLNDITPTMLAILHATDGIAHDGMPLPLKNTPHSDRALFFESSYSVDEIEKPNVDVKKVVMKAVNLYEIDATGLLSLKPKLEKRIFLEKQKAVMWHDWYLAKYPALMQPGFYVLLNLKTGQWTTEMTSTFAQDSPYPLLMRKLSDFYGHELT